MGKVSVLQDWFVLDMRLNLGFVHTKTAKGSPSLVVGKNVTSMIEAHVVLCSF